MPATRNQIEAARAQETEADTEGEFLTVPLAGYDGVSKDVRVLPANRWRASALRALNRGDIDGFMQVVLHEDDYDIFEELDPDTDGIGKFAEAVSTASGEALGKSSGRSRSGSGTRRS
ncbi:hypothetical protein [Streptomyces sp. NPDC059701]|uniref:hypothetical protein n=1 Tax=Streptomyces sp. NPDC059701 TaxID=3346914 RepID=UPI00368C3FE9